MAYGNKYISSVFTRNGHTHQLLIAERDYSGSAITIEGIKGIWLEVQGSSEPIETPIVKTSLTWSIADAPEKNTASEKWGGWEELFTPDATKFRVQLKRDNAVVWSGFITPDSWSENLEYHAALTFTARDLLGHLSDFEFDPSDVTADTDGLSSVKNLIEAAWAKASIPMTLSVFDTAKWLQAGTNNGYEDFLIDLTMFDNENWYQVVEDVLAAMGLCLRYVGGNTLWLAPLRFLPYLGGSAVATRKPATILNRSGVRTIDLAYKQIIETGSYEIYEDDALYIASDEWVTIPQEGLPTAYVRINKTGWYSIDYKVFPADQELANVVSDIGGELQRTLVLYNTPDSAVTLRHKYIVGVNTPIKVSATFNHIIRRLAYQGSTSYAYTVADTKTLLRWDTITINWRLRYHPTNGLNDLYLNNVKEWVTISSTTDDWTGELVVSNRHANVEAQSIDLALTTPNTLGDLYWECAVSVDSSVGDEVNILGVVLSGLTFAIDNASVPKGWKVTTNYDENQNTILRRDAVYGICPSWIHSAGTIRNGIFLADNISQVQGETDKALYYCHWGGESSLTAPLPVWAALQILTYHTKANSVFEGEIKSNDDFVTFGELFRLTAYEGQNERILLLKSGTLDLMTGYVNSAILQEVGIYDEEWEGITSIDYNLINGGEGEYGSGGASGGGGGGSSSGSGGGITPEQAAIIANMDSWFGYDSETNSIYIKKDAANNARNFYAYGEVAAGGAGSGGSGDSGALYSLVDVYHSGLNVLRADGTARQNGDALVYNATQGKWVAAEVGGVVTWNQITGASGNTHIADITINGSIIPVYAPSGGSGVTAFNDLTGRPQYNGTAMTSSTDIPVVPTAVSQLTNDSGYVNNQGAITACTGTFLPLSGGILTTTTGWSPLALSASGMSNYCYLTFKNGQTSLGQIGMMGINSPSYKYGSSFYTLYHSGNLSSSVIAGLGTLSNSTTGNAATATNASQLGGLGESRYFRKNLINTSADCNTMEANSFTILNQDAGSLTCANKPSDAIIAGGYGVLTIKHGSYANQLFFPYAGNGNIFTRSQTYNSGVTWGDWNKVYHSGNCNNASTAWSASSLTLNGAISGATKIALGGAGLYNSEANWRIATHGYITGITGVDTYALYLKCPQGIVITQAETPSTSIYLNSSGYVGIGTTSPSYKLDVNGEAHISGTLGIGGYSSNPYMYFQYNNGGTNELWYVQCYDGGIGIGKGWAYSIKVDGSGNLTAIGEITAGSDLRWKEHITPFSSDILKALTPVEWDWVEGHGSGHSAGFVAQDIKDILPYAVKGSEKDGYTLNYNVFHAVWAVCLQNHESRLEYLERENKELKEKLNQITNRIWQN